MRFEKDIVNVSDASACVGMHQHACISVHQCASVCISMHQLASVCISMHQYAQVCRSMHQHAYVSMHQHASACISMHQLESVRIWMPQYAQVCISMHQHASARSSMQQWYTVCIESVYNQSWICIKSEKNMYTIHNLFRICTPSVYTLYTVCMNTNIKYVKTMFEKDIANTSYAPVFVSMHQHACISAHQCASVCISMHQ